MTSRDFCYWLQGYLEIGSAEPGEASSGLSPAQTECIQKHLVMVFKHEIDPSFPAEQQEVLNNLHKPQPPFNDGGSPLIRC